MGHLVINCNVWHIYPVISKTVVKREHLHQIFRLNYTNNVLIPNMWLHITKRPLWNWYFNQLVLSVIDKRLIIETFENHSDCIHRINFITKNPGNTNSPFQKLLKRMFNIPEVGNEEESVRKRSLELNRNVNWKRKKHFYLIQILKNELKNKDFYHLITKAGFQIIYVSVDTKNMQFICWLPVVLIRIDYTLWITLFISQIKENHGEKLKSFM